MLALLLFLPSALACSYVEIPWVESGQPSYLIPRTMELGNLFGTTNYSIEVVPRAAGSRFGYVAPMNLFHAPAATGLPLKVPFEGINEVGLTVSAHYFAQSVYEQPQPGKKDLSVLDVLPALLANCATADDALELLASVSVVAPKVGAASAQPDLGGLHWAIADASGRSIILEYLEGERVVLENNARVMTNDPDIKWHWRNLNAHVGLSPTYPLQNDMLQVKVDGGVGAVPRAIGHGWNLLGLPGDSSSPSRFVRLFYLRGYAIKENTPKSFDDAVVLGTALLNNVFIPFGSVAADPRSPGDGPEYTAYAVLKSCQERVMLVRGYRNSQWRKIDLKLLDFTKAKVWALEDGLLGIQDITRSDDISASRAPLHVNV